MEVLSTAFLFLPLLLIAWLANLAEARRERDEDYAGFSIFAYLLVALVHVGGLSIGLILQFVGMMAMRDPQGYAEIMADVPLPNIDSWGLLAAGLWVPSLLGLLFLLPFVRRGLARFIKIDPQSPVHAISLSLSMLLLIQTLVFVGVGLGNFADLIAEAEVEGQSGGNLILAMWTQQILTALLAFVGVGWLTRRSWKESCERLGLVVPSGRQSLIGLGVGVLMVPAIVLLESLTSLVGVGTDADVARLTEQLIGSLVLTPLGILTLGLSAGLGEETIFRGAIQPRFGLVLTSLLFAITHSNYGISLSTLIVLLLGLVLGWLRLRYNTSTAIIAHAVYNMTLGVIGYLYTMWGQ